MQHIDWRWCKFDELNVHDLYQMLALRQRIFVIEQQCVYLDADGIDQRTEHLTGYDGDELVACLRLLPPHVRGPEAAIGRVAVHRRYRRQRLGHELMRLAVQRVDEVHKGVAIHLAAQAHLARFYASFNFEAVSEIYDEDGINHVDMRRAAI